MRQRRAFVAGRRNGYSLPHVIGWLTVFGFLAISLSPHLRPATPRDDSLELQNRWSTLRAQIELYRFQHEGRLPAQDSDSETEFLADMLCSSHLDGSRAGSLVPLEVGQAPYGPYFSRNIPENPLNGRESVLVTPANIPISDGSTGWWYCSTTGEIRAHMPPDDPRLIRETQWMVD